MAQPLNAGSIHLSIVAPCYNEAENIPGVVKNFARSLGREQHVELILVDNGSRDETGRVIDREIARHRYTFARKVTVPDNQGYGCGILAGLKEARGNLLAWTHADLQTDPDDVVRAYHLYLEQSGPDQNLMIKGYRKNRRFSEKLFSLGMQALATLLLGVPLSEINAQPKLFPRKLFEAMTDPPVDFSLDLYLLYLARKLDYRILAVPVDFRKRIHGEAKGGGGSSWPRRLRLIRETLRSMIHLRKNTKKMRAGVSCG